MVTSCQECWYQGCWYQECWYEAFSVLDLLTTDTTPILLGSDIIIQAGLHLRNGWLILQSGELLKSGCKDAEDAHK